MISYDSTRTIAVTKKDDTEYYIRMFDLETYKMTFSELVGGTPKCYIKMKDVEQNKAGTFYALSYIDDGVFKIRTFGKVNRSEDEIAESEININEVLGISNFTLPIANFPEPYINCCFITDDMLFVNFFYNSE